MSARDVDASAGDRAEALNDERHARRDRQRARQDRHRAAADRESAMHAAAGADKAQADACRSSTGADSRSIIDQAQGILIDRLRITALEAFQLLVQESQAKDIELHEVAAMYVEAASGALEDSRRHRRNALSAWPGPAVLDRRRSAP